MTAAGPKVFVVDDDPSVRKGPRVPGARTVCRPVCLVLDVRMPGLTGLALQEALAAVGRRLSIVFVTGHVDVPMSVEAMKGGAVDLLTKPSTTRVVAPVGDVGDDSRTGGRSNGVRLTGDPA
jgi:DNA-binding NtrC family response regulator